MEDEAALGAHWSAKENRIAAHAFPRVDLELFEQFAEFDVAQRLVDDHAHGVLVVMFDEQDHRALETRIAHVWHGDQQLAREEVAGPPCGPGARRLAGTHEGTLVSPKADGKARGAGDRIRLGAWSRFRPD